ncbi:GNAT family N-acetyltransferase [Streptomyces sp. NBC_00237]|uniref:GNAT family N-acetyltransferase n=1 Tax=Streptomyces sp. NBC_00237 TaxID=2975687 RepID=UPI00224EA89E|nr:GNAT family N-acetyltransferase [Streptomyces sp. NBC_00237]MCX5201851.1 GNAT family N-acetyltransferase [Streptomyces sp. NBC_00237]
MRPATKSDLPQVVGLGITAYGGDAYSPHVLRQLLDVHGEGVLVLEGREEPDGPGTGDGAVGVAGAAGAAGVVGYVLVARSPRTRVSWVLDLVVDKRFQGLGFGRRLLSAAVRRAERDGVSALRVTAEPGNRAAVELCRSLDFVVESDDPDYFGPGERRLVLCRLGSRYPMR